MKWSVNYFTDNLGKQAAKKFIMLNGFVKKTQKTPKKEIELAKIRMKEVLNNE